MSNNPLDIYGLRHYIAIYVIITNITDISTIKKETAQVIDTNSNFFKALQKNIWMRKSDRV